MIEKLLLSLEEAIPSEKLMEPAPKDLGLHPRRIPLTLGPAPAALVKETTLSQVVLREPGLITQQNGLMNSSSICLISHGILILDPVVITNGKPLIILIL